MTEQYPQNSERVTPSETTTKVDEYYIAWISGDTGTMEVLYEEVLAELEAANNEHSWLINSMHYAFARSTDCQIRSHPDSKNINQVADDLWKKIEFIEAMLSPK